jgi:hypothetical protein
MLSDRERAMRDYPDEFEPDDDEEEEDEFESFDCAMDRNGYCGKAGSEECEFECPYNWLKGIKN